METSTYPRNESVGMWACKLGKQNLENEKPEEADTSLQVLKMKMDKAEITETVNKMSCICNTKDKTINTLSMEELEKKKLEVKNLQKAILSLRQAKHLKRKYEAKLLKLSVSSKHEIQNPCIEINAEIRKRISYENELVREEIKYFSNNALKQDVTADTYPDLKCTKFFKHPQESLYKVFVGRVGHISGLNSAVFILLSSEAFYVIDVHSNNILDEVLYENIKTVMIGEGERWLSVVHKKLMGSLEELTTPKLFFQVDFGESSTAKSLIKYLEVAVRRRLLAVANSVKERLGVHNVHPHNMGLRAELGNISLTKTGNISIARWLEPFIPTVVSCAVQEVNCIEKELMQQLKMEKRPTVVACWLVFWESGSEFWCDKKIQVDGETPCCLDGFLMVNNSVQTNRWTPFYFYLKNEVLHQFREPCDQLPQFVIRMEEFCGCRRLSSAVRPHSFELLRRGSKSLVLAAPNESAASHWLQAFLKILSVRDNTLEERRRLKACQVIQTTETLILSHQTTFLNHFYSNKEFYSDSQTENVRKSSKRSPTGLTSPEGSENSPLSTPAIYLTSSPIRQPKAKLKLTRFQSRGGGMRPDTEKRNSLATLPSSPTSPLEDGALPEMCPPTPPLPEILMKDRKAQTNQPMLQILAICNLNQIAEVFVSTSYSCAGCFLELECNEASEIAGDWALYFHSQNELKTFLESVLQCRQNLTEELLGVTKISSGRVHDLLVEGSSASANLWNPPTI